MWLVLKYKKVGLAALLSQNDMQLVFTRTFRRAGLPVVYSDGFAGRVKMAFSPAPPYAVEVLNDAVFVELNDDLIKEREILERLNRFSIPGVVFTDVATYSKKPKVGDVIKCVVYKFYFVAEGRADINSNVLALNLDYSKRIFLKRGYWKMRPKRCELRVMKDGVLVYLWKSFSMPSYREVRDFLESFLKFEKVVRIATLVELEDGSLI